MSEFANESVSAIEGTLNDVDRALERLRAGTYRTCHVCHTPIEESALVAILSWRTARHTPNWRKHLYRTKRGGLSPPRFVVNRE